MVWLQNHPVRRNAGSIGGSDSRPARGSHAVGENTLVGNKMPCARYKGNSTGLCIHRMEWAAESGQKPIHPCDVLRTENYFFFSGKFVMYLRDDELQVAVMCYIVQIVSRNG
jgi:hypothetical protein